MSRTIAIANQKGGVGKTTTTVNLGAALMEQNQKVLLLDCDPQGSLTTSLGLDPEEIEETLYNVLLGTIQEEGPSFDEILYETPSGLDLAPANIELSAGELDLSRATMGEFILKEALEEMEEEYDFILIDCPPNLGLLTINALAAADQVIVPLQADYLALKGVDLLIRTIATVQRKINRSLEIAGVLLTMVDIRTLHAREVEDSAREVLKEQVHVFDSVIRLHVRVKEAPVVGESILTYDSDSHVAEAYRDLARELIDV